MSVWSVETLVDQAWIPLALFDSHVQAVAYALQLGIEHIRIMKGRMGGAAKPSVKDWSPRSRQTA